MIVNPAVEKTFSADVEVVGIHNNCLATDDSFKQSSISFSPCKRVFFSRHGCLSQVFFKLIFQVLWTPVKVALDQVACLEQSIFLL